MCCLRLSPSERSGPGRHDAVVQPPQNGTASSHGRGRASAGRSAGEPLRDRCQGTRFGIERAADELEQVRAVNAAVVPLFAAAEIARQSLMGRRSPRSVLKRSGEQALREKRGLKQAKKDARAAERRSGEGPSLGAADPEAREETG